MKSIKQTIAILVTIVFAFSCKKNKDVPALAIDYSKYKVKKAITTGLNNKDTITYTYNGENISYTQTYSQTPNTVFTNTYTKTGNQLLWEAFTNNTKTLTGYNTLNSLGYIDTASNIRTNNTINNTYKSHFTNNNISRYIADYQSYKLDYYYYYNQKNNRTYSINNLISFSPGLQSKVDSVVYEYAENLTNNIELEKGSLKYYYPTTTNLIKATTIHNITTNSITSKNLYQYEFDSKGLVTKRILQIFNLPSNSLSRSDTTYYTYYE